MKRLLILLKSEDGVTSIAELMAFTLIIAIVISGAYVIYDGADAIYASSSGQADAQRGGRLAQHQLTKHLRMLESFETADDYSANIRADLNDDSRWDAVSYYIESERLYEKVNDGAPVELAFGVRNQVIGQPLFRYYDRKGIEITDSTSRRTKAARMRIDLVIDTDVHKLPEAFTLSSEVTLRNRE